MTDSVARQLNDLGYTAPLPKTFDPDVFEVDTYDDRGPKVVKEKDPVRQKIGRNNRARGARAERDAVHFFEKHGWTVITQSGPNRRDFIAECACVDVKHRFSVENKSITKRWPYAHEVRKGWEQSTRQAKQYTPLLVFCLRSQGKPTQWRRYTPDGFEDLGDWLLHGGTR